MNFVRDVVGVRAVGDLALIERTRAGDRRQHTFGDLADRSMRLASHLAALGVRRGDVVLTLIGSRVEWVEAMLACFGAGYVALACSEQLRPDDLRQRIAATRPAAVVADERNRAVAEAAAASCPVVLLPDAAAYGRDPAPLVDLAPDDPCLVTFTSGTTGEAKPALHAQRYLPGQSLQTQHWLDVRSPGLVWCTAGTGWSKSARNSFVAGWLGGATVLLHDARFDPAERVAVAVEERVTVWCMAPTEYRLIAARAEPPARSALRSLVAAGEALGPATLEAWRAATGLDVRDGYGQTETGQVTANPPGAAVRPGSMGRPLPGVRVEVDDGELVVDPASLPTFFAGYLGEPPPTGWWRTGDRVRRDDDGYLYFEARADDVIISSGYRIGPAEVEAVLGRHPAVAEVAVVAAPDEERGAVVRAVVVCRPGVESGPALARDLQEHARAHAAPYKYPRVGGGGPAAQDPVGQGPPCGAARDDVTPPGAACCTAAGRRRARMTPLSFQHAGRHQMDAVNALEAAPAASGLSDRDRAILAFERQWWKYAGAKEQAIREQFDMSATRYYQVLNALLDRPESLEVDPLLIKRLRRLRASRQRARSARRLGMDA